MHEEQDGEEKEHDEDATTRLLKLLYSPGKGMWLTPSDRWSKEDDEKLMHKAADRIDALQNYEDK